MKTLTQHCPESNLANGENGTTAEGRREVPPSDQVLETKQVLSRLLLESLVLAPSATAFDGPACAHSTAAAARQSATFGSHLTKALSDR